MKALLLLGGPSGKDWEKLRDEVKPNIIFGANGSNVHPLDVWLCSERMTYAAGEAEKGNQRYIDIMEMFQRTTPRYRYVNKHAFHLLEDKRNAKPIVRSMVPSEALPDFNFTSFIESDESKFGLLKGDLFKRKQHMNGAGVICVGTVAFQLIHLAAVWGASEIHTIGFDMCFRDVHHWYKYPAYEEGKFFNKSMFTKHAGLDTMWIWIEGAEYAEKMIPALDRRYIKWIDHSNGLLQAMGIMP